MFRLPIARKLVKGRAGVVARLLAVVVVSGISPLAGAACFNSPDPAIHAMQQLADNDGNAALTRADAAMRDTEVEPNTTIRRAWLQAVRAQAFSALELDPDARDAAIAGMKLVSDNREPVNLALRTILAENVYDAAGIETNLRAIEAARAVQIPGSLADACLLTTLGMLRMTRCEPRTSTLRSSIQS